MAQFFNNRLFVEPGADVAVDYATSPSVAALSSGIALVVGSSENGQNYDDRAPYVFATPADARNILKSGIALDLINCLFNPSPDFPGASQVIFLRVNKGYPASFIEQNLAAPKPAQTWTLNVVWPSVEEDGRLGGFIGLTLGVGGKTPVALQVEVTTSVPVALAQLTALINKLSGITAELEEVDPAIPGDPVIEWNIIITSNYTSTEILATSIISPLDGTATLTATVPYLDNPLTDGLIISTKDKGQNQDFSLKSTEGIIFFYKGSDILATFTGILNSDDFKREVVPSKIFSTLFTYTWAAAEDSTVPFPDTDGLKVAFTVKANETPQLSDYISALERSASLDKSVVICDSSDEGVHQAILASASIQATWGHYAFLGAALGETPTEVKDRAAALNYKRATLAYPGCYLNLDGTTKLYSSVYTAAKLAGLACGVPVQTPLTRKKLAVLGFEEVDFEGSSEQAVRESLINCGVTYNMFLDNVGYVVNKGVTTIQGQINRQILGSDNNTTEISISRIEIQMQKEIKNSANIFFPGTTRLNPSKTDVIDFYRKYFNSKVGTYLTGWDVASLKVWVEEDAWFGSATVYVNGPINHAFFTLSFSLDNTL